MLESEEVESFICLGSNVDKLGQMSKCGLVRRGQLSTSWRMSGNPRSCRWTHRSGSSSPWWSLSLLRTGAETWTVIIMWRIQAFIKTWTRQILKYIKPWICGSEQISSQWSSKGTGDGLTITSHKAYPLPESTREKERRQTKKHLDAEVKRSGASWRNWSWAVIPGEPLFLAEVQTWVIGASKFLHPESIFVDRRAVHIYARFGWSDNNPSSKRFECIDTRTLLSSCVSGQIANTTWSCAGVNGFCGLFSLDFSYSTARCVESRKLKKKWIFHRKKLFGILAGGANVI